MEKRVQLEAAQLELALEDGSLQQRQEHTVATFAPVWSEEYVRPNCSENYLKTVRHMLDKHIIPSLGEIQLSKLTPLTIEKFLNLLRRTPKESTALPPEQRKRKPTEAEIQHYHARVSKQATDPTLLSEHTVLHYYNCLNSMLERAVAWKILAENPMETVTRPRFKRKKMKFLDDDQALELLRRLSGEEDMSFRAAVLLALTCGLRLGEVGGLLFSDVDFKAGTIDISRAYKYTPEDGNFYGDPKSDEGARLISLPLALLVLLDETRKYQAEVASRLGDRWRGTGLIVCGWDGSPLHHDTPSKQWRKFADRNGFLKVRFHDLRHTHATLLLSSNIDAVAVASRMGHSDAETTLREYAHALRKRDVAAAEVMQRLFGAAGTDAPDVHRLQTLHPAIVQQDVKPSK
mgnify:FL=1